MTYCQKTEKTAATKQKQPLTQKRLGKNTNNYAFKHNKATMLCVGCRSNVTYLHHVCRSVAVLAAESI